MANSELPHQPSPAPQSRLTEATIETSGAAAVSAGTSLLPEILGSTGATLSTALDIYAVGTPLIEGAFTLRRIRRLRRSRPRLSFKGRAEELELGIANAALDNAQLIPKVEKWRQQEYAQIGTEVTQSKRVEKRKKIKMFWYPVVLGVLRSTILSVEEIPHKGNLFKAFPSILQKVGTNLDLLSSAFQRYIHDPKQIIPTLVVMAAAFVSGLANVTIQKAHTRAVEKKYEIVDSEVRKMQNRFSDDKLSIIESAFGFLNGVRNAWKAQRPPKNLN